nr:MAG TPA: DNA polymerase [Caudoviricetes sp.]
MLDFLRVATRQPKKGVLEIYPKFIYCPSSDLMVRGGDFYAIWDAEKNLWSTDENTAVKLIDAELEKFYKEHKSDYSDFYVQVMYMWDTDSGSIDKWHKFVQKQCRDSFHPLDEALTFANDTVTKESYVSRRLPYSYESAPTPAWDEIIGTLYSPEERMKLEWAIGAIVTGESKKIQKFIVMYGAPGAGKGTIINIIQLLFEGYCAAFDAQALGNPNSSFALESFRSNPLVGIQHDGNLSKIEDNTRLNSLVSHEVMTVNEKFKSSYPARFNTFLFMGTNKPVRITDAKSGIIRRLIDVSPSGNRIPAERYHKLMNDVKFELGGIAAHCKEVFEADPRRYDEYIPLAMMGASNSFYNYVLDNYDKFKQDDGISMKQAWELYKNYNAEANVAYGYSQMLFKEELKSYFKEFHERLTLENGTRVWNYYRGFLSKKFEVPESDRDLDISEVDFPMNCTESLFDKEFADCPAQYATQSGTPLKRWADVTTKLSDISTNLLHYVNIPEDRNVVFIDFDLKDPQGNKSFKLNAEAASKWPKTYAELSKGGEGIHLVYYYTGDASKLSALYSQDVEIKVFTGGSSMRRRLSRCNDIPIATISSGLPIKEEKKVVDWKGFADEKHLRACIARNLLKKNVPYTKPSINLIYEDLEKAYKSGMVYDVTNMIPDIQAFALRSTHNSQYCLKKVSEMKFKSEEESVCADAVGDKLVFFDVEVFPNLFVVVYKPRGEPCVRLINPTSDQIELLCKMRLVGFNNRDYDNHILYARMMKYTNEDIYKLSKSIIKEKRGKFGGAYNLSYTDIYDFSSTKQSLKKWEIALGIHHLELEFPWDEPVPEKDWDKVAEYCENDVVATEALFDYLEPTDFLAREILADLAGMSVNTKTNDLTAQIIFGADKKHTQLVYTHMDTGEQELPPGVEGSKEINSFPGYEFKDGKNMFRGVDLGRGGWVYGDPGIYLNVALLDIASMHPNSAVALMFFGKHTENFKQLLQARIYIKHKDYESAKKLFGGKLAKYLDDPKMAKKLSKALKIPINAVYGLTSARFENPFYDKRNVNNIVALRGALFMKTLFDEVTAKGFRIIHVKTDSIKIAEATPEIIQFCMDFAKKYGYTFEHEATYEKICLVNNAVYVAKAATPEWCQQTYGYLPEENEPSYLEENGYWTATGTQFQVPYVFKTLFSKQPVDFEDKCEVKSSKEGALYLDFNEELPEGEHNYRFVGKVGQFTPMKNGAGGAKLLAKREDKKTGETKYVNAPGATEYRWMESEMVRISNKKNLVDENFYISLVDDAKAAVSKYGDFEWFTS